MIIVEFYAINPAQVAISFIYTFIQLILTDL